MGSTGDPQTEGDDGNGLVPDLSPSARREDYTWDSLSPEEKSALEKYGREEIEDLHRIEDFRRKRQKRVQRRDYADRIFNLMVWWLLGIGLVLFLQAMSDEFHLTENVVLALIGGTTANVLGIFYYVAKFLFRPR